MQYLEYWTQFIINGVIAGSLYALIASGFSVIYNTNKFIHFAHGGVSIFGGYIFYTLSQTLLWNYALSGFLAAVIAGVMGVGLYRLIYRPLKMKNASNVIMLLSSIALLIVIGNTIQIIYSERVKTIDVSFFNHTYSFFSGVITTVQILLLLICVVLFISLYFLVNKTGFGRSMRAIAYDEELALSIGINVDFIKNFSFFIGSFIGGVGGVFIALDQSLTPTKGSFFIIKGFTGSIIGGLEFVSASILGSYFLGLVENLSIVYLHSEQKLTVSFLLLFIFLIFRPQGFMGFNRRGRK